MDDQTRHTRPLTGRVTIPTDMDVVPQTLEIMKRWGADAIRDCDGTDFRSSCAIRAQRSTPPITRPARITRGRRRTPRRCSSATS